MKFQKFKINDIGKVVSGGTPSTKNKEYWNGDIAWITPKDLSTNEKIFVSSGERNITKKGLKESSAKIFPKNTVLMTSRAPIGYIAISKNQISTNQGFKSVICNDNLCYHLYFYYWLKNNMDMIKNNASGSTFQEISAKVFKNIDIFLPNVEIQKKISKILYKIDMKIEINKNINKNLEDEVELIFKNWFVNFQPFNDKNFQETSLGKIPEGWKVIDFKDLLTPRIEKSNDQSIPKFSVTNNGIIPQKENFGID